MYSNNKEPCKLSKKIEFCNVLLEHISDNGTIRQLTHTKTKQVLVVKGRDFLEICVRKKLDEGKYIELGKCVTLTDLKNSPPIRKVLATFDMDYFLSSKIFGGVIENRENYCLHKVIQISDPNSSVGMKLLKGVMKSSSIAIYKNLNKEIKKFLEKLNDPESKLIFTKGLEKIKDEILNGEFEVRFKENPEETLKIITDSETE